MDDCILCNTPLLSEQSASPLSPIHNACLVRSVVGGIGHLLDHDHFCTEKLDPDAGLSYRISALLVDAWINAIGFEELTARSTQNEV